MGGISLIGRICTTDCPASATHLENIARSLNSPMPQLSVEASENSGTLMPLWRRIMP